MRKAICSVVAAASLAVAAGAGAQPSPAAEMAAIRSEITALMQRLERLEQATGVVAAAAPAVPATPASPPPVAQSLAAAKPAIRFSGDMRYRHESINDDAIDERSRHRIRARFGVAADVGDDVQVGLVLATGGDDPVSANQTLDGGFSRKPLGVDRAFFTWQATEQLSLTGGKMANPFYRSGSHHLIYDADLNPEGLALRFAGGNWFANYATLWVEEQAAADDSLLLGGQVGYRRTLDNGMRLTTGVGYYDYLNTQGQLPFYDGTPSGNSVDGADNYLNDFNEAQLFAELTLKPGDRPVTVFADYVTNTAASAADQGFAVGASLGEVSGRGTWRVAYAYQDLEADAVIATFTDSDFAGGGTDGKGHVIDFNYGLRERLVFGFRYFLNQRGAYSGNERDYNRLQADVTFAY